MQLGLAALTEDAKSGMTDQEAAALDRMLESIDGNV